MSNFCRQRQGRGASRWWAVALAWAPVLGLGGCVTDNPDFLSTGDGGRDGVVAPGTEAGLVDTGGIELGPEDAGDRDLGRFDLGREDRGLGDRGLGDRGLGDLGTEDRGLEDRGLEDRGLEDAEADGDRPDDARVDGDRPDGDLPDGGVVDRDRDGVPAELDCDDEDPLRYPGAPERCNDLDDDCDGLVDEDFVGLGDVCSAGVGRCQASGRIRCGGDPFTAACDAQPGLPVPEACNDRDDDCDGLVDEGVPGCLCTPAAEVCDGVDNDCDARVDEGVLNACGGCGAVPAEVCNGLDDDCDGVTDEGVLNACGACGAVPAEVCNGQDDDCDGRTDEGVLNACGACGAVPAEVCNGQDDDCDGRTDEGVANACGACGAVPAEVCNRLDDDCDGRIDEGVLNACGACGAVPAEVCNGRDDDCDGRTDEGVLNACGACGAVPAEACNGRDDDCDGRTDEGADRACQDACGPGIERCVGGRYDACDAPEPVDEVCNGVDDDCDGVTDEGTALRCESVCGQGFERCVDGGRAECDARQPVAEACNLQDDDCDGQVDEGLAQPCLLQLQGFGGPNDSFGFGTQVQAVDDLTGDGVPEVLVASLRQNLQNRVSLVNGATGAALWTVSEPGEFGTRLAYVALDVAGNKRMVVSAPTYPHPGRNSTGSIFVYDAAGVEVARYDSSGTGRFGQSLAVYRTGGREVLAIGEPRRTQFSGPGGIQVTFEAGRVVAFNLNAAGMSDVQFETYGLGANARFGEFLHSVGDLNGDGNGDLIATQRAQNVQRTVVVFGGDGTRGGELPPPAAGDIGFGEAVANGRLVVPDGVGYAYGLPGADFGAQDAGLMLIYNPQGIPVSQLGRGIANAGLGQAVVVLPRPHRPLDTLLIGARNLGRVEVFAPDLNQVGAGLVGPPSLGRAMSLSAPLADGTRRLFVAAPEALDRRGEIQVYSVR